MNWAKALLLAYLGLSHLVLIRNSNRELDDMARLGRKTGVYTRLAFVGLLIVAA